MQILTTGKAAKIAHCSQQTIIRLCDNGTLPNHRIPGSKHRRINQQDLENLMKQHNIPLETTQPK